MVTFLKILKLLFFIIILGLMQMWIVTLILIFQGLPYDLQLLLRDGGVFFFATSLSCGSLYILLEQGINPQLRRSVANREFTIIVSGLLLGIVFLLTFVGYAIEFADAIEKNRSPEYGGTYFLAQVTCFICSVFYAFFVAVVTGSFLKRPVRG